MKNFVVNSDLISLNYSMNKVIIGVPVRNDLDSLKEMIYSLKTTTNCYNEIIAVIGKDCNQETIDYLISQGINVRNIQSPTPLEAYNYLFDLAKKERCDLFLTQTDVIFPKLYRRDWLNIMSQMAQYDNIGAVTCINGGGQSGPDYINGFSWLGGWCVYYPLRTLDLIGGFDKDFPNGMGVDIDHSYRIHKANLKIIVMNYWVDHHMMNERPHDRDPKAEENRRASSNYFKKKWGLT